MTLYVWNNKLGLMKNYLIIGAVVLAAVVGYFIWSTQQTSNNSNISTNTQSSKTQTTTNTVNFSNPKKSAHYESNTPAHGITLAGVPVNVVIDFNFDLAKPSDIKILKDSKDFGVGETIIDANKLSMRRNMSSDTPNGLYTVEYKVCWSDGSCHDGSFQFAIDRSKMGSFEDQTGKKEVTIKLSQIQFNPQNVKVSKGTKVTWVNDDSVEHYVNTDSHPAHTYYPAQNSKLLKKGESFSLNFNQASIYPYHCSAHASSMVGTLLVE